MDLYPYLETVRGELTAAADVESDDVRRAAERLARALEPAVRLALMEALSQAAAEITRDLPAGSVEVRLRGRDPEFVVDVLDVVPTPLAQVTFPAGAQDDDPDDSTVTRITLRLPESLKTRAEELAAASRHSLNTWIVQAIRQAARHRALDGDVDLDVSSLPFPSGVDFAPPGSPRSPRRATRRMTGWV